MSSPDSYEDGLSLKGNVAVSKEVISDALLKFQRTAVLWNCETAQTTLLFLIRSVARERGTGPPPAIFVNHGRHPSDTYSFVSRVSGEWGISLVSVSNKDALEHAEGGKISLSQLDDSNKAMLQGAQVEPVGGVTLDSGTGHFLLEQIPLVETINIHRFQAIFLSDRLDRHTGPVFISRSAPLGVEVVRPLLLWNEAMVRRFADIYALPEPPLSSAGKATAWSTQESEGIPELGAGKKSEELRVGGATDEGEVEERLRGWGY